MRNSFTLGFILLLIMFVSCKEVTENNIDINPIDTVNEENQIEKNQQDSTSKFTVKVYEVNNNQFGYDILMNGQPYIHQPHIPAVGGNNGFSSHEKANTAGNYIINKLENNIIPPTITINELDSLGLLN